MLFAERAHAFRRKGPSFLKSMLCVKREACFYKRNRSVGKDRKRRLKENHAGFEQITDLLRFKKPKVHCLKNMLVCREKRQDVFSKASYCFFSLFILGVPLCASEIFKFFPETLSSSLKKRIFPGGVFFCR